MERRRWDSQVAMLTLLLMVSASVALASTVEQRADYRGWRVLEVILDGNDADNDTMSKLHNMENPSYLNILRTRRDRRVAEVAVSPEALEELRLQQQQHQISFSTLIHDLSKKLDTDGPSIRAVSLPRGVATYDRFMDVDEITAHLEELPNQFPDKVSLKKVGNSVENRPIYLITVTSRTKRDTEKPIIFIDGGIHAREWISFSAALNIIGRLLESPSLTRHIEWQIIPMLNPDGYAYTWTNDRLWRKNRATVSWRCSGTDLNRNFDYHWGETGASTNPCSTIYRGSEAFSEPESRALRDTMLEVKDRIKAYITIHSYGQYILFPWGYTTDRDRYNDAQLFSVGEGMAKAIKRNDGTVFSVGSAAKLLYPAAGASDDWAAGEAKVPLVYTLELRDEGAAGFVLPEHLIMPAVNDAWICAKYLGKQLIKKEGLKLEVDTSVTPAEPRTRGPVELKSTVTQVTLVETPVNRDPVYLRPTPVYRDPVYIRPTPIRPIYRRPTHRRPTYRRPNNRGRYDDSSEEDSSSEESSEEDSDEDKK